MTEQLISFETAKLAKEKGFKGLCHYYFTDKILKYTNGISNASLDNTYLAPSQSLLQKWIMEVGGIYVSPYIDYDNDKWKVELCRIQAYFPTKAIMNKFLTERKDSYENAMEMGLYEALKSIELINKKP